MGLVMLFGLLLVYPALLRFFSVRAIMHCAMASVLMGLVICAVFPAAQIQWIFSAFIALCTGIAYVSLLTVISNQVTSYAQGAVMGYLSALLYFAWMITGFDGGFLISWHITFPLYAAALFLMIAAVGFMRRDVYSSRL